MASLTYHTEQVSADERVGTQRASVVGATVSALPNQGEDFAVVHPPGTGLCRGRVARTKYARVLINVLSPHPIMSHNVDSLSNDF